MEKSDVIPSPVAAPPPDGPGVRPVRLSEQSWPEGTTPLVSICCITFNHERFIGQALEGFLMQETTFPVEIIVHDDASTDRNADIIRDYQQRYPHVVEPIYQTENQYSKGTHPLIQAVFARARGRYIALCEGDDYWTSAEKLARQVAFLQGHPSHSLCWTRFETLDDATGLREMDKNSQYFEPERGCSFGFTEFVEGWHIGTQTLMFRHEAMNTAQFSNRVHRDIFLISDLLTWGPGYCLGEVMAVYRAHAGGVHSSKSRPERLAIASRIYKQIALSYPANAMLQRKYELIALDQAEILRRQGDAIGVMAAIEDVMTKDGLTNQFVSEHVLSYLQHQLEVCSAAERELRNLHASWSLRIGRAITLPLRAGGRLIEKVQARLSGQAHQSTAVISPVKDTLRGLTSRDKERLVLKAQKLQPRVARLPSRSPRLVVSLTSYPARMEDCFFAVVSLLCQTTVPDLLVLWLAQEQFPEGGPPIPERILALQASGLRICWCKNLRSYTKLVPALREFPNDVIVTADDDIYYPPDWLERLYRSYLLAPGDIHAHRAHRVALDDVDGVKPYGDWTKNIPSCRASFHVFPTGVGGVLYPPSSLHPDVLDEATFRRLAPHADDLWFWVMALRQGTRPCVVDSSIEQLTYVNPEVEAGLAAGPALYQINRTANDEQLAALLAHFTGLDGVSPLRRLEEDAGVGHCTTLAS